MSLMKNEHVHSACVPYRPILACRFTLDYSFGLLSVVLFPLLHNYYSMATYLCRSWIISLTTNFKGALDYLQ